MRDKNMEAVANAGAKDGEEFNKKVKKITNTLKGKPWGRQRKIVSTVGEMKTIMMYIGLNDKKYYRKVNDKLEIMVGPGKWQLVHINADFLQNMKLREY